MIASTLTAIASAYDANTALSSGCPLFYEVAPDGQSGTWAVFFIVGDGGSYTFSESFEDLQIGFTIFAEAVETVITLTELLRSIFDQITTLSGLDGLVDMRRVAGTRPMHDPDGGWLYHTRYQLQVQA